VRKNVHRRCAGIDEDGNYIYFDRWAWDEVRHRKNCLLVDEDLPNRYQVMIDQ
jgi:hypothetical protein